MINELLRLDKRMPVCPHCGHQNQVANDLIVRNNLAYVTECAKCGKQFEMTIRTERFYTTNPLSNDRLLKH
jgi:transcription elongation factor Elf1